MNRRRFTQLASIAGLGFIAPFGATASRADSAKYEGPYWIILNAGGGWDPTVFCDPKGGKIDDFYTAGQIEKAGNIPFAPTKGRTNGMNGEEVFYTVQDFFEKYYSRVTVINGIDTETNNHDVGTRTTWSGDQAEDFPCFAGLAAAVALEKMNIPLAFLSNGGYDTTNGTCSLSRVDADAVARLAYPNLINPTDDSPRPYNSPNTASRIASAQLGRLQAQRDKQTLPSVRSAMSSLYLARGGDSGLSALAQELSKAKLVDINQIPDLAKLEDPGSVRDAVSIMQQAQIAMLSFKAGVAVSANLGIGGFDTHSNHDEDQSHQVVQLLRGLAYILDELKAQGLDKKTYVLVGSDFGRTPSYNAGKGKDHWNITSMLMSGPKIEGNRVIGATDGGFVAKGVDSNLKVNSGGPRITTGDIHIALRKLAGITGSTNDQQFPLIGSALPFFG